MDKKFIIKTILLNTAWVVWIVLSVVLGYVIYREAFPEQPVVIIPFSLLFLVAGSAVAFFANRYLKRREKSSADNKTEVVEDTSTQIAAEAESPTEVESGSTLNSTAIDSEENK